MIKIKNNKIAPLYYDRVFKIVFSREKKILIRFLNNILGTNYSEDAQVSFERPLLSRDMNGKEFRQDVVIVINEKTHLAPELIQSAKEQIPDICFTDETQALEMTDSDSLLIIVDTHKKSLLESQKLFEKIRNTATIDHHRKDVNYIDNALLFFHDPNASSASEMVTEIIPYFKNFTRLPEEAANALLAGIMLDTKNFVIRATVRTFEAAAYLKKMGADTVSVKKFFTNSIDFYRMKAAIVSSAEVYKGFAISVVETIPALEKSMRVIASQAADELMNISDINASFLFTMHMFSTSFV